jgi:DNA gyrase subunit A
MLMTENGVVIRTQLDEIRETGRSTQGVTVMNLSDDDRVIGRAVIDVEAEAAANSSNGSNGTEAVAED